MPAYGNREDKVKAPSGSKLLAGAAFDLRGLDLTTPVDAIKEGRTPFAKNFRLYAQQADSRRVTVSSRKGSGYIMEPVGQVSELDESTITDAGSVDVGIIEGAQGVRFQASSNNRLTRVDLKVSDTQNARGTLLVEVWSDNDGIPAKRLAISSITSGDIGLTPAWLPARFVNAVKMTASESYWIIIRMQDDGENKYTLDTTSDYQSYATDSTIQNFELQDYGINIKIYSTPEGSFKGSYRYLRDNGTNTTVVARGDGLYYFDEATKTFELIVDGLNSNATDYRFAHADNKVFWVNGYDELRAWDGTFEVTNPNLVTNGTFEVNSTGWDKNTYIGGTVSRTTSQYHSGTASLSITNTSGVRAGVWFGAVKKNHRYKISYWVKATAAGTVQLKGLLQTPTAQYAGTTFKLGDDVSATTSWQKVEFYMVPGNEYIGLQFEGNAATGTIFIDDVSLVDTGISIIEDTELKIASDIVYNKDRLWLKTASDPNRLQWCEAPGNPTANTDPGTGKQIPTKASEQWYNEWRSKDFMYVPRPHNGSPVVGMHSFQDSLTVFTQDKKYIVSGYDTGSYTLRESTGSMGCYGNRSSTVDENNIYFVGKDGFYKYNGSSDEKISDRISPLFDACPRKEDIRPVVWKNQVRFYMSTSGSTHNDVCVIYNKDLDEFEYDTNVWVEDALWYRDADDNQDLIEFSSLVPQMFVADQNYHSLGQPIDFEYRFKYDSMGAPGQKKRIKRFVPVFQGVDSTFPVTIGMDKNFQDSPRTKRLLLTVNGSVLDDFELGDGTLLGGDKSFKAKRQSYSGYANYWQFRIKRKAVNNRVAFVGAQFTYKTKRL